MAGAALRSVDGILLLDKPAGLSSNAALQTVKRLYRARKAGHGGSLDPLATGLLPICLGAATKVSGFLLNASKTYRFTCRLGITTSTGDAEGAILQQRAVGGLEPASVMAVLARFRGEISQRPPMYSALKHQGQRLYRLARRGIEVDRPLRQVVIHELRLLQLEREWLECEARCSKGTYIRTLAEDLGEALGCGAHVAALRRTQVEPYDATRLLTLDSLRAWAEQGDDALDALLLPADTALTDWPVVQLAADTARALGQGRIVRIQQAPEQGSVRLYGQDGVFLGLGEILEDGRLAPRRLLQTAPGGARNALVHPPGEG